MAYPEKTPAVQFHVDCSSETKSRFALLHQTFGFKTNAATFEAAHLRGLAQGQDRPGDSLRMETKLDRLLENFDNL
jgi:hypothetical protein